jgi:two-component system, chemotaxis family, CheB/CheR fusion protein
MNRKPSSKSKKTSKFFPIAAIGASAGGLEAVSELVTHLPNDTGMAFVYIQHLDPTHKSLLPEIIGRLTKMKVQNAEHLMPIRPNNIYIIPQDKDLYIIDGVLTLNQRQPKPAINMPVDKFFKSLADIHKEIAIGIVLSGTANDGTYGLKEIKNAGGLTFAQDSTAKFENMPKSAIAEGCVDMILSPKEIAIELGRISKNAKVIAQALKVNSEQEVSDIRDEDLTAIVELLRKSVSVDFQHYKPNTIKRRIIRRMLLYKLTTLSEYFEYLKQHTNEIQVLFQDLLINVTEFFRDPNTLEFFKKIILPKILKRKKANDSLRIWVPACSSGEEAYSLAIIVAETLAAKGLTIPVQIFASDLSENAIAKARTGLYSRNDVANVSAKRLQQFFTKIDGSFRINKVIRDVCVFAPQNVFSDPPFSRLDLISCCNFMIYLGPVLQKKILSTFHYSLMPEGYLILGKSETLGPSATLFSQIEKKFKVFIKKSDGTSKAKLDMHYPLSGGNRKFTGLSQALASSNQIRQPNLDKTAEEILLSKYVPASVVVNKDLDILQLHGPVNAFIQVSPGKATLNLLKLVRTELIFDLRNTIYKAVSSNQTEKKTGIEIKNDSGMMNLSLEIIPLKEENDEKLFLIVFQILPSASNEEIQKSSLTRDQIVKNLQKKLKAAKDDMRFVLEAQEASNEELQAANEEIVSSNEELQSINEELETSKEETESSNEELMTINNELQVRNEQLAEAHDYSEAISETIREAVLVLDKDFRVKSANKAFYRIFKTKEEDTEGMLVYELGNRQWDILELRQLFEELIATRSSINGFEVQHNFPLIGHKTMLLHATTITQKILNKQFIILAIEDITEHRLAQGAAKERELWFKNMADNAPCMIWISGQDKGRSFFNKTWSKFIGANNGIQSESWKESIHPEDLKIYLNQFDKSFNAREPFIMEYRLKRSDGQYRWTMDVAKPYFSDRQEFLGYIGTSTELHEKKLMLEDLDKLVKERTHDLIVMNRELQRSNSELRQFAYVASHDLQEPLRKIQTYIDRIQNNDKSSPDEVEGFFVKIMESSKRMSKLIDDLLEFSRLSFSPRKFSSVNLNQILDEVISDFDLIIHEKKAIVSYDKSFAEIQGERLQISQLFHNLIGNALKFTKEGKPPKVAISFRMLSDKEIDRNEFLAEKGKPYLELSFSDNGIGFNEEFADQIFVIFQRLHDKKKYPGTGIGLAICKKIVSNHGGVISAKSNQKGATFYIVLPLKQQ